MGKKGDALRAAKAARVTRTFTEEQLRAHDQQIINDYKERYDLLLKKELDEQERKREEYFFEHATELWQDSALTLISYFYAMACRILVEEFGWPVPHSNRQNLRLIRYGEALANEIERVTHTEKKALKDYAEETKRLYGIEFIPNKE